MKQYQRVYCKRNVPFRGIAASCASFDAEDGFIIERVSEADVRVTRGDDYAEFPWENVYGSWPIRPEPLPAIPPPPPEPEVAEVVEMPRRRKRG